MVTAFGVFALAALTVHAELIDRWSFNDAAGAAPSGTNFPGLVHGTIATVRGNGATLTGNSITLPGTTTGDQPDSTISAYIDLPNGIISSRTNLTVEIWATPLSSKTWQRLLDFGRAAQAGDGLGAPGEWTGVSAPGETQSSDSISLSIQQNGDLNAQRLEAALDGSFTQLDSALPTSLGVQYHYVLTYEMGVGAYPTGGRITWYRNGVVVGSTDVPYALSEIEDVNNWLGRSQFSADSNSNISYNEVRIYDNAFGAQEVASSYYLGPESGLRYRWSFNEASGGVANGTVLPDSISGAPAVVRGVGASRNGAALTLPGTTTGEQTVNNVSAYIDLPNGIISSLENLTIEAWATPVSSITWQRLFDFGAASAGDGLGAAGEWTGNAGGTPGGTTASDEFALTLNLGPDINFQRLYGRLNYDQVGGLNLYVESGELTATGVRYHYVVTFEKGVGIYPATGGRQSWYRNGSLITFQDLPYTLSDINDVNNWLGRSQFSGDSLANVSFDEFRIYSFAFSPADVIASRDAGPDALFNSAPPVAVADSVTMHRGQKALVPVLENDTGAFLASGVSIDTQPTAGTVSVDASGRILYSNTDTGAMSDTFRYTVWGPGGVSNAADVTVNFSNALRITNPALAMPTEPPSTFYEVVDALPGLTFTRPICLVSVPGDSNQLYVCEQTGVIRRVADVTSATPTTNTFLNLSTLGNGFTIGPFLAGQPENGLLGLAFHPNYATNGYFYVAYTVNISGTYYQRVSRFSRDATDPTLANPASELILLNIADFGLNHNGGDLHFGPFDGYLYYGTGDGENSTAGQAKSQRINDSFYSGIFRIDVDKKPGSLPPSPHASIPTDNGVARFNVPPDNPFVHTSLGGTWNGIYNGVDYSASLGSVRTEFWATGIRHCWRMSFDPVTGDLWEGDVGQSTYEEVNRIVKGGNYGWAYREGAHNFNGILGAAPAGFNSIDPVFEYLHSGIGGGDPLYQGNSVCGGYVYRGTRYPELVGSYIFCDSVSGHIWQMNTTTGATTRITGLGGAYGVFSSMGVDPSNKDILFCAYLTGKIMRLTTGSDVPGDFPTTLSTTGLFADLTDLSPNPGLLPFEANLPFWSDHAIKRRWFTIPNAVDQITWAKDANWTFPTGMVWVKHFDLELERGNPDTKRRIETRVLVKTDSGMYGVSYRWNDAQTDATLVPDGGVEFNVDIDDGGNPIVQKWGIPSRSSCLTCHTPQAGGSLSLTTRQLNRTVNINGFMGNQLTLLYNGGYLANDPGSPNLLPRHLRPDETAYPLEARVRSYLAVNCAYCHRADGTVAGAAWDGRPELTLAQTGLINGEATDDHGNPANKYVVPADLTHSIVYNRVAVQNGFTRMPPLASNELDQADIDLLEEWITTTLPARLSYDDWRQLYFGSTTSPEGDPGFDADVDLETNNSEFLGGTNPLDPTSFSATSVTSDGLTVDLGINVPANRTAAVMTSTDLENWELWDVPGNDGITLPAGPVIFSGTVEGDKQFFKIELFEN